MKKKKKHNIFEKKFFLRETFFSPQTFVIIEILSDANYFAMCMVDHDATNIIMVYHMKLYRGRYRFH